MFLHNYIQMIFKLRVKPRAIQLPVTNRCNSRCIACGIWKNNKIPVDIESNKLKEIFRDPFFSEVHAIGLSGGEPSLHPDINGIVESILILKKLKRIYVISNGIHLKKLLSMMRDLKIKCSERHIKVYLTISIDGIDAIHDAVRGVPGFFNKSMETLKEIIHDKEKYCDILSTGTTLSIQNIPYIIQTEAYLNCLGIDTEFHLSVPNKRLFNFDDKNFSVLNDEKSRMLALEYFYSQFKWGNKNIKIRLRAFLRYDYLLHKGNRRLAGCNYLRSDITITDNLDLCLCATASAVIGNLNTETVSGLLKQGLFKKAEKDVQRYCQYCVHYIIFPNFSGIYQFIKELLKPSIWIFYRIWAAWLR